MIRETCLAIALVALVVAVPGIVRAAAPVNPSFYFSVISDQVATGEPIVLQVVGPPNDTFTVSLNPEPFNTSQPVFSEFYQLPPVAALENGSAIGEVSVNTTLFAIAGYLLIVRSANSTIIGQDIVYITVGTPTAVLAGEIEQLRFDLQENASRLVSTAEALDRENIIYLYVVGLSGVEFVILLLFIIGTRTAASERRFWRRVAEAFHRLGFKGRAGVRSGHWSKEDVIAAIDPTRVWVMDLCATCEKRHTREELLAHAFGIHRLEAKAAEKYFRVSREARKEIMNDIETMRVARVPRKEQPVLDLSDLPDSQ